ncbi:MAG: sigma-70 family RNA polymerase sigma factor [Lachnospiraceae bacterium]|nr:sigma-70 family RNA polymerase sigma factor [Lachnospiraceae bacterium]
MLAYLLTLDTQEDRQKLVLLYESYRDSLYYLAYQILHDEGQAEDAVQETFFKVVDHLNKIQDVSQAWGYLSTILRHKIYDGFRQQGKKKEICMHNSMLDSVGISDTFENRIIAREEEEYLVQCLRELPYPYKDVLYLKYFHEYSALEIADMLEKSPDNIRQIAKRGKEKVKQLMIKGGYVS